MSSRPRIVLVIDKMIRAGTQRHVLHLLEGLADRYEFHVVSLEGRGPWDETVRRLGGHLHVYGLQRLYDLSGWQALMGLTALVKELRPVGIETFMFTAHVAGAWAAWRNGGIPLISSRREKVLWRKPWHFWLRRRANRLVRRHICNSQAVADDLVVHESVPHEDICVIDNGLDLSAYEGPHQLNLSPGHRHGVVLAALKPVKQHGLLLEALALAKEQLSGCQFHLIGEGPLRGELEKRVTELDLSALVVFEGQIDPVMPELSAFDVAVLPSRSEGFSNSLLECLGAGLATVAFDVDGNREAIRDGETGCLVAPGDVSGLASALVELLEDDAKRESLGVRACEETRSRYSVDAMCKLKSQEYEAVFSC